MKIKSLEINHIQGIQHFEISNFEDNITLLIGMVGTGKTTILVSIYSFFCDAEIIRWYDGKDVKNSGNISIVVNNNGDEIRIDKNILNDGNHYTFICQCTQSYLLGNFKNSVFYYNSYFDRDDFTINQFNETIAFLEKYDVNIAYLSYKSADIKILSAGQLEVLNLVRFISKIPPGSVVLLDGFSYTLDAATIKSLLELFKKINNIQFICGIDGNRDIEYATQKIFLTDEICSKTFNNNEILYKLLDRVKFENETDTSKKMVVVKYKINDVLQEDEKTDVEYKTIQGNNSSKVIPEVSEQYAVAFLNSTKIKCGTVKWGVTNDGVVKGIILNRKLRDEIRCGLQSRINSIFPSIESSCYELNFERVVNENNEIIKDLYVVELIIYNSSSKILYATSKGEVYIKLNGVKQKLTSYQIQKEALRRNGL